MSVIRWHCDQYIPCVFLLHISMIPCIIIFSSLIPAMRTVFFTCHHPLVSQFHRHIPKCRFQLDTLFPYAPPLKKSRLRRRVNNNHGLNRLYTHKGISISQTEKKIVGEISLTNRDQFLQHFGMPHRRIHPSTACMDYLQAQPNYSILHFASSTITPLHHIQGDKP